MNKICTSIEQSKKLMELGIDVNTADMYYSYDYNIEIHDEDAQIIPKSELDQHFSLFLDDIPAWSLSALLELIPTSIDEYTKDFSQLEITKCSVSYVYAMGNLRKGCLKDNLLDAAFEMVCWLKENNKL